MEQSANQPQVRSTKKFARQQRKQARAIKAMFEEKGEELKAEFAEVINELPLRGRLDVAVRVLLGRL